jgi:putative tricarboxylic transport membrane protein
VILLVRGVRELRAGGRLLVFGEWLRSPRHVVSFLLTCGAIVFYLLTVQRLGFLVTATLLLLALFLQLRVRPWLAVLVALAAAFAIHLAFYKLLRVSLPWGVLPILY